MTINCSFCVFSQALKQKMTAPKTKLWSQNEDAPPRCRCPVFSYKLLWALKPSGLVQCGAMNNVALCCPPPTRRSSPTVGTTCVFSACSLRWLTFCGRFLTKQSGECEILRDLKGEWWPSLHLCDFFIFFYHLHLPGIWFFKIIHFDFYFLF